MLRASADAWVQVRDRAGPVLLNRILHAGETWEVPPKPNLLLTTGNAGGTDLVVDGVTSPPLGGSGAVRRDLPLDPDLIKDGKLAAATSRRGRQSPSSGAAGRTPILGAPAPQHTESDRMSYRPYQEIIRRKSRRVYVGRVPVGDGAPITVQTMTNTLTTDVEGTIAQIRRAELAGVDIVRVSCPDQESALALKDIVHEVNVPIVADIHFHYKRAIEAADSGAACLRINPGNIGSDERVKEVIRAARDHGCSMRIGVNAGSLEKHLLEKYGEPNPEALVESALYHANILQQHDFHDFKISVKASDVFLAVAAYQQLAEVCDHPLHIGITEAGGRRMGTVKSSIGLGSLLWAGIGDTLRVSLSDEPEEEVRVGWDLLKALGIRHRGVKVISCPSCARQGFNVIETVQTLEDRLAHIETPITLSIIGCVVNGPGEALMTDIGLTGGGNGRHMIYRAGKTDHTIDGGDDGRAHRRAGGGEGGGAEGGEGSGEAGGGVIQHTSPTCGTRACRWACPEFARKRRMTGNRSKAGSKLWPSPEADARASTSLGLGQNRWAYAPHVARAATRLRTSWL